MQNVLLYHGLFDLFLYNLILVMMGLYVLCINDNNVSLYIYVIIFKGDGEKKCIETIIIIA